MNQRQLISELGNLNTSTNLHLQLSWKSYRLVDTFLWYITILPNLTFQVMQMLPQRLPTAFLSLANMPSSPPVLATLSFRGDPSAMYVAPSCSNLRANLKLGMGNLHHNFKVSVLTPWVRSLASCPDPSEMLPVPGHVPSSQQEVLWSIFCIRPTSFLRHVCPPIKGGDLEQWRNHSFLRQSSQMLHCLRSRKSLCPKVLTSYFYH